MTSTYNPLLVVLSVVVAIIAAYAALDLASSITSMRGRARRAWLTGGALAMGTGIWSMHFVGMLALEMPGVPIAYDVPLLILSVVVAIAASGLALFTVTRRSMGLRTLVLAALSMGAAIAGMHYIGMWSMRMPMRIEWDASLVAASVAIAVGASFAALWLAFHYRTDRSGRATRIRLGGAVVEGFAIAGMHYTAMAAASFVPLAEQISITGRDVLATSGLAVAVTAATLLLLSVALTGSIIGRELTRRRALAEENERLYNASQELTAELGQTVAALRQRTAEAERAQQEAERARDAAEAATQRVQAVQRITDAALAHLGVDDLLHALLTRVCEALECDTATLLLVAEDSSALVVRASHGLADEAIDAPVVPLGRGVAGRIAERGEPMIVPDTSEAEIYSPTLREHVRSLIGVPLRIEERTIGVLLVGTVEPRDFTPADLELLVLVAERSAYALERTRLYEATLAASRAKTEFLASMSHELRTPINAVIGYTELLELGLGDEGRQRQYLARIRASSEHLLGLITDILDLAKIESGRLNLQTGQGNLCAAVADAIALVEPMAVQKGIQLVSRCDGGGDAHFQGDTDRVRQIVVNLLSNAIKFTPALGRVTIECGQTRVSDGDFDRPVGEWSYVRVEDTGIGIAPEKQELVFQPFMQVDGSLTRSHGGTGLGLTISR